MVMRYRLPLDLLTGRQETLSPKIRRVLAYIDQYYDRDLKLSELGILFGFHPDYLCRKFKKETGISFHEYFLRIRIQKAMFLLSDSEKAIKEISFDLGFRRPEVFSRAFKRMAGCSPKSFRNQHMDLEGRFQIACGNMGI